MARKTVVEFHKDYIRIGDEKMSMDKHKYLVFWRHVDNMTGGDKLLSYDCNNIGTVMLRVYHNTDNCVLLSRREILRSIWPYVDTNMVTTDIVKYNGDYAYICPSDTSGYTIVVPQGKWKYYNRIIHTPDRVWQLRGYEPIGDSIDRFDMIYFNSNFTSINTVIEVLKRPFGDMAESIAYAFALQLWPEKL